MLESFGSTEAKHRAVRDDDVTLDPLYALLGDAQQRLRDRFVAELRVLTRRAERVESKDTGGD